MKLDVTLEEAQYLLQVMGTRPFNEVANLINKVAVQVQTEQQARAEANAPKKSAKVVKPIPPKEAAPAGAAK